MDIRQKAEFLKNQGTKELVSQIHESENELANALMDDNSFRNLNHDLLTSYTSDSERVELLLAELKPPATADGKKMTVEERKAWLLVQRDKDTEIKAAINLQTNITFLCENNKAKIEMARRRLDDLKAILSLKTAQILFLSEPVMQARHED